MSNVGYGNRKKTTQRNKQHRQGDGCRKHRTNLGLGTTSCDTCIPEGEAFKRMEAELGIVWKLWYTIFKIKIVMHAMMR